MSNLHFRFYFFRITLALFLSFGFEYIKSTILIFICFSFYFTVNLPFKSSLQNYRSFIVLCTMGVVLCVAAYYESVDRKNTQRALILWPSLLQLSLMILCVPLFFIVLIYEIYLFVKESTNNRNKHKLHEKWKNESENT